MEPDLMAKIDEIYVEIKPFATEETASTCARIVELYAHQTDSMIVVVEDAQGWQRIKFLEADYDA